MTQQQNSKNELNPELLGLHSLNFSVGHDSSSRSVMFASHFSQRLVINGANEKRIQTGVELEFGKHTFSIKMPVDARIIKVIDRYPKRVDLDSIAFNPETVIIYEDVETKEIGHLSIPYYGSYHQYFGFKYVLRPAVNKIMPGAFIAKDTIFADTPSVSEDGGFSYGISLNMAFMSHPAVSEDGIMISEDVLDKLKFKVFETRVVEFGNSSFPLNLYGTNTNYKPFPDIGEEIRSDGLLMMLRKYNYDLAPVEMSVLDTREPDWVFDKGVYVRGPRGKIVDIKVYHNEAANNPMPTGIMTSMEKYSRALKRYYRDIIDTEKQIRSERKKKFGDASIAIKPSLHRLTMEGLSVIGDNSPKHSQHLNMLYRKAPLDEYRVEFVIEYELRPTTGFKLTDSHGIFMPRT